MYNIIALFGESGAGKDTILKNFIDDNKDVHGIVSYTTRPPRKGETNGVDYHFVSDAEFARLVLSGEMLEATKFRNWHYGTAINDLKEDQVNIGVFNIDGIECLLQDTRLNVTPIRVYVSNDKTRLIRALNREERPDCMEICRRFIADEKDFDDIPFEHICLLSDDNRTHTEVLNRVYADIKNG